MGILHPKKGRVFKASFKVYINGKKENHAEVMKKSSRDYKTEVTVA